MRAIDPHGHFGILAFDKSLKMLLMTTAPQRGVLASFALLLISMLSAQALAFDVGGLSYAVINATDVEVTGRASGNTDTDYSDSCHCFG